MCVGSQPWLAFEPHKDNYYTKDGIFFTGKDRILRNASE